MALVSCRECGKEVSSSVNICPFCGVGYPSKEIKGGALVSFGLVLIIMLAVVVVIGTVNLRNKSKPPNIDNSTDLHSPQQLQEQSEQVIIDYNIKVTAEYTGIRQFLITGTSNLPEEAYLEIQIYDENYFEHDDANTIWRNNNLTFIPRSVKVRKDGGFALSINATTTEARMKSERYIVDISFNPRLLQNPQQVKSIVGEYGEYLGGELVNKDYEWLTILKKKIVISASSGNIREGIPFHQPTETEDRRVVFSDMENYSRELKELDTIPTLVSSVREGINSDEVRITVTIPWLYAGYELRLKSAESLWALWARIHSPSNPDKSRIRIVDISGNELGGSRLLAGSLIYVKKD